jgi:hypothetical protein
MVQLLIAAGLLMFSQGDLIVSEIMYNPDRTTLGDDNDMEWIELYNASGETLSLGGLMLSDGNNQLFLTDYLMVPSEFVVVCADQTAFTAAYGQEISIAGWSGTWIKLSNSGDTVIIYTDTGELIEEVIFSDQWGVTEEGGKSPADGDGASLEKIDLMGEDSEENWQPSIDYAGLYTEDGPVCWGTPGAPNSQ